MLYLRVYKLRHTVKLPTARNKAAGVCCEVAGIIEYSSICNISTTAYTYRATTIKGGKAAIKI